MTIELSLVVNKKKYWGLLEGALVMDVSWNWNRWISTVHVLIMPFEEMYNCSIHQQSLVLILADFLIAMKLNHNKIENDL